jgi:uncharacterized protein YggU (UPF0235/DUF167 family)
MRARSTAICSLALVSTSSGTRVNVRVIPRACRTAVAGVRGDALLCRLAAAPVDGVANDALIALLSQALGVCRHAVHLQSGARSRTKAVAIEGLSASDMRTRLAAPLALKE